MLRYAIGSDDLVRFGNVYSLGSTVGCLYRCKRKDMNDHNLDCTYAKLAPMIMALEKRLQKVQIKDDCNRLR